MLKNVTRILPYLILSLIALLPRVVEAELLDQSLTGTVVVEGGRSFALFQPGEGLLLVREGDDVIRGVRLVHVRRDRVVLEEDGRQRELFFGRRADASPATEAPVDSEAAAPHPIQQVGELRWEVDCKALASSRIPLAQVMTQVQVSPHQTDGRLDGLELATVNPGGLIERLGFREGDVIRRINELETLYMEHAYAAYQDAVNGDTVRVDLVREGKSLTLSYALR